MNLSRLLKRHLHPYRRTIEIVILLQALQTIANLMIPTLSADLINKGVLVGDNGFIWTTGGLMLLFSALQVLLAVAATYFGSRVAMGFARDIRRNLFHQVTDFSAREVAHFGAPSLITRITNDVQQVQMLVVMGVTMMIAAPITMVVGTAMAVREDVGLSIVLAVAIPVIIVSLGAIVWRMVPSFQKMQIRIDHLNTVLREQLTGIRVVRAFVREPQETKRFAEANEELTNVALRAGRLMSLMFPTVGLVVNLSSIGVLWVGADRIASGDIEIGSLIAYLSYAVQVLFSVVMVTFMISMIPRASVSSDRIVEVLDTDTTVAAPTNPVTALTERGTLEFRNVGFRYPGAEQPVLADVSFRIEPGQTTAIIGATGSGKSTLVSLVSRLMDVTEGAVLVDGVDVRQLDPDLLWGKIGYAPQRSYLFSGTVASNLRFGKPDATDAELWEALDIAQATSFVQAMPNGLNSEITQGGTNVSGGQRQRLAIARALVVRPEIYVFDDSFSALDLTTDARLRAALAPHITEAAMLIVAQRVSTIRHANQILVLERGQLVGAGTHAELVATCPTYAEIVQSQDVREVAE